jgi:glutathione S-transferase
MTSATELRLYDYVASCNCYKVRLLLAQLGFDYERVPIDIFAGDTLTEEYGKINPARSTPVLETDGHFLAESNAILAYLANGTRFFAERRIRPRASRCMADLRASGCNADDRRIALPACDQPSEANRP